MMSVPLVTVSDMDGQPGAPFSQEALDSAGEAIRREAGWHIAPVVTETLTIDASGGRLLMLPTLRLLEVTEVRDMSGDTPRVITGWRLSRAGMLSRPSWPCGFSSVEVDVVHGYETCPAELLPLVASRVQRKVRSESIGGRSVTFEADSDGSGSSILSRFKIPARA